jgi:hypothetical protein
MKNFITNCILLLALSAYAQEAGKVGELLKNEASAKEMDSQRSTESLTRNETRQKNPNYINRGRNSRTNPPIKRNLRWNYKYGTSEVFLRIPESGYFTVEVGDQMMSNANGKFRFFDLRNGNVPISIYENNYLIYRTRILINNNTRTVLDFFVDKGLYLLGTYPLQNQVYGFNEWDDLWNNSYFNQNNSWNGNSGIYGNVMTNFEFEEFLSSLKRNTSFDNDRIAMISSVARNTFFTSMQIQHLLKTLNFDKGKVEVAKQLYGKCVDRQNFYMVYEAFDFDSSKRELSEYIARS